MHAHVDYFQSARPSCARVVQIPGLRRRVTRAALFAIVAALFLALSAHSQAPAGIPAPSQPPSPQHGDPGSISGIVVDETGKPVEHVALQLFQSDLPIHLDTAYSDRSGHFVISSVPPGEWILFPSKVEDGYADQTAGFGIIKSFRAPRVEVRSGVETSGVRIQLPPKAATVHIDVSDADTNQPIRNMVIDVQAMQAGRQMSNGDNGKLRVRHASPADVLIAPGVVRIDVQCFGYEPWAASENDRPFLSLHSGEHRTFALKLHRGSSAVPARGSAPKRGYPSPRQQTGAPGQGPPAPVPQAAPVSSPPQP